jgi:hypothetical protein
VNVKNNVVRVAIRLLLLSRSQFDSYGIHNMKQLQSEHGTNETDAL